jgi:Spy/CpxP family protein refolding chaperone
MRTDETSAALGAPAPRRRSRGAALLLLTAAFVAGALVGAGATTLLRAEGGMPERHARGPNAYLALLARELDLSPAQRDSVRAVLERHHPAMDSLWQATRPRLETLRAAIRSEIRTQLTPAQRTKYEQLLERHHHDGPPPPPR